MTQHRRRHANVWNKLLAVVVIPTDVAGEHALRAGASARRDDSS